MRIRPEVLRDALQQRSLSQNAWAMRIGISSSHLSMLLSGERRYPSEKTRSRLLSALEVSSDELFETEVVRPPTSGARLVTRELRRRAAVLPGLLDFRSALRSVSRRSSYSLLVLVVLAIGIGSTTAIFSVVDAVLIRPLPFQNSDRLVAVWQTYPPWRGDAILGEFWDHIPLSYLEYGDWRAAQTVFDDVALYAARPATLMTPERALPVTLGVASRSFFPLLGIAPRLGHGLESAEAGSNASVAVIAHRLWRGHFGGDPDVIGQTVRLDQNSIQIIGVLPEGFAFRQRFLRGTANSSDVWMLAESFPELIQDRGNRSFSTLGRIKRGVTPEQALAETEVLLRGERTPEEKGARILPLLTEWTREAQSVLMALLAAVGLLLLVACGTAAGLMLGDGARRSDEIVIRTALGASAPRLVGQFVKESLLLGLGGAVAGLILAQLGLSLMAAALPAELPRAESIGIDFRIVAFALALAVVTTLLFGVAPALYFARRFQRTVRAGRSTPQPGQLRWQSLVVGGQIALCFLLVVATALLGQSWLRLKAVDSGFRSSGVLAAALQLPAGLTGDQRRSLVERVWAEAMGLPGVARVGGISHLPLTNSTQSNSLVLEDTALADDNPEAQRREVLPGYFETASIPLLEGRLFDQREWRPLEREILVNRRFAARFWGDGRTAIGRRIQWDRQWWTIVGVVGDVLQKGLGEAAQATFYVAYAHNPRRDMTLVIGTDDGQQSSLQPRLHELLRGVHPEIAVTRMTPLDTIVTESLASERFRSAVAAVFALSALGLAVAGIYGVASRMVAARIREIGVRMAIGATRSRIVRLVLVRGQLLALAGIIAGSVAALASGRTLAGLLYGVTATDLRTYLATAVALLALTLIALVVPAARASRVDPASTLRGE